ncbi:hypothetical protein CSKR_200870, partial [Clonorchis sinensis]
DRDVFAVGSKAHQSSQPGFKPWIILAFSSICTPTFDDLRAILFEYLIHVWFRHVKKHLRRVHVCARLEVKRVSRRGLSIFNKAELEWNLLSGKSRYNLYSNFITSP